MVYYPRIDLTEAETAVPRFFADPEQFSETSVVLTGTDAGHLARVLRAKPGERLTVCDGAGHDYDCVIETVTPEAVSCSIRGVSRSETEPSVPITLYLALSKGDKLELVVQKAVELGVSEICLFSSARCVVRLDAKGGAKRVERLSRVAHAAAKQSGRGILPVVSGPISFSALCERARDALFCYECERETSLRAALEAKERSEISLVIGPEGGFDAAEADAAVAAGLVPVSLGPRILRCETAPICALSAILYHTDDLSIKPLGVNHLE